MSFLSLHFQTMRATAINRMRAALKPPVPPVRMVRAERDHLYKIQFHQVKPAAAMDYRDLCREHLTQINDKTSVPMELMASFSTWYGKQDEVIQYV